MLLYCVVILTLVVTRGGKGLQAGGQGLHKGGLGPTGRPPGCAYDGNINNHYLQSQDWARSGIA